MTHSIVAWISNFLWTDLEMALRGYKDIFMKERLDSNIKRQKKIFTLLFYCNLLLLLFDRAYYSLYWSTMPAYKNLYYSHLFMLVALPIFIYLYSLKRVHISQYPFFAQRFMFLCSLIVVLLWCEFLSINAQYLHEQISAYIICAFCIASTLVLTSVESIAIFSFSFLSFAAGLSFVQQDISKLSGNLVNASLLIILAFFISRIMFFYHLRNFIDKKIIEEKTVQLNDFNQQLETIISERTKELTTTNGLLIKEMEIRHQAELEATAARSIYDEKEKELHQLLELDSLRTSFFSNISHEFKTPINVILSAEQLISFKLKSILSAQDYKNITVQTGIIRQNCYRLIRLVSNLIDITKIDSGYFNVHLQNHDIVSIVEEIVQSVVPYIERNGINIVFDTEVEEKTIACDADKIERVMLNLLSNAIKFTPRDGSISVNITEDEDNVTISVRDTGAGISYDLQSVIFDRFIQADTSLSTNYEGSGIGLSIVRSIVEMHNGSISVISEPGVGSEFLIKLPCEILPESVMDKQTDSLSTDQRVERIQIEFSDIYAIGK